MSCRHSDWQVCLQCRAPRSAYQSALRHISILELGRVMPPMSLKEIALAVYERHGDAGYSKRPMHHTSVLHHLRGKCRCREYVPELIE